MSEDLPTFVVMNAVRSNTRTPIQAMSARMWSAGFLPAKYSGVSLRAGAEPVLFINNPDGVSPVVRRRMLDAVSELNQLQHQAIGDPDTLTRIAQYEMAYRMQASVPELTDLSAEPASVYDLYGEDARRAGSFAQCCLTTRRLLERGTRFVQIWLNGWDVHSNATGHLPSQCLDVDRACYGFVQDLKQRGMLDDPCWYGAESSAARSIAREVDAGKLRSRHHPRCFTMWMAGAGVGAELYTARRTTFIQYRQGSCACEGLSGDHPSSVRDRPRQIFVPVSGTRRQAHRCRESARRQRHSRVGGCRGVDVIIACRFALEVSEVLSRAKAGYRHCFRCGPGRPHRAVAECSGTRDHDFARPAGAAGPDAPRTRASCSRSCGPRQIFVSCHNQKLNVAGLNLAALDADGCRQRCGRVGKSGAQVPHSRNASRREASAGSPHLQRHGIENRDGSR